jgi:hypothetical protein
MFEYRAHMPREEIRPASRRIVHNDLDWTGGLKCLRPHTGRKRSREKKTAVGYFMASPFTRSTGFPGKYPTKASVLSRKYRASVDDTQSSYDLPVPRQSDRNALDYRGNFTGLYGTAR